MSDLQTGDLIAIHGNGVGVGETYATKSRQGTVRAVLATSFRADLWSASGDSGSPVGVILGEDGNGGFQVGAAGILTACPITDNLCTVVAPPGPHVMGGPTFPQLLTLARQANLCLRLVLEPETGAGAPSGVC